MSEEHIELAAVIGIDWADEEHVACMRILGHSATSSCRLEQSPEAISEWALGLKKRFEGQLVGICLEQSRGPLIYALSRYPWVVLYPINPKSLARYRETLYPSGKKDDPSDAELLCDFLYRHHERLRAWKAQDKETRQLQLLLEQRETLVDDRTRLTNRLGSILKGYFPQALKWAGPLTKPMSWTFLLKWHSLEQLQKVSKKKLLAFYYAHGVRRGDLISLAYDEILQAVALHEDKALIDSSVLMVNGLCKQLQVLQASIDQHEKEIKALFASHPETHLFKDLPGAGPVMGPRLVVTFGTDRERFQNATELQQLSGIAPITKRSGKTTVVHWRWAAPSFLRQSLHEFACHSIGKSVWARVCYQYLREKGKGHHSAVRVLAFKWIRILFRCWQEQTPYNEEQYIETLRRRGSHLVPLIDAYLGAKKMA